MKSFSSHEVISILKKDGWFEVDCVGSHHQFKHPEKKGRTTVPHPKKDLTRKTLDSIERQSGLRFR
jgi:predicted RNA binding protein YcfA (HicA-like mRNA interferase family)